MVAPVLAPTNTGESQLARRYSTKVKPLGGAAATEKVVFGVSNFTPDTNFTTADNSDYDSNGWGSDTTTQRKWVGTMTLQAKLYAGGTAAAPTAPAVDAGQAILQSASDNGTLVTLTYFNRNLTVGDAYEVDCIVQWKPAGGTVTDLATTTVNFLGQGAPRPVTNPMGP